MRDPAVNPFAQLEDTRLGRFFDEIPDGAGVQDRPDPDVGRDPGGPRASGALVRSLRPIPLSDGGFWKPLDACLGVPGLPQSATGQATILSGKNAARRAGRHVSAIPDRRVRELLEEDNLFRTIARAGRRATFANAYMPGFFARRRPHISATPARSSLRGFRSGTWRTCVRARHSFTTTRTSRSGRGDPAGDGLRPQFLRGTTR